MSQWTATEMDSRPEKIILTKLKTNLRGGISIPWPFLLHLPRLPKIDDGQKKTLMKK